MVSPEGFGHQTDQSIDGSIRKQNPGQTKGIVRAGYDSGAGYCGKGPDTLHVFIGTWCGCESIKYPAGCNKETRSCPHCNSAFHAKPPLWFSQFKRTRPL